MKRTDPHGCTPIIDALLLISVLIRVHRWFIYKYMLDVLGNLERTHTCGELRESDDGKQVVLMGWVAKKRDFGVFTFIDLRDRYGVTQIVVSAEAAAEAHAKAKSRARRICDCSQGRGRFARRRNA